MAKFRSNPSSPHCYTDGRVLNRQRKQPSPLHKTTHKTPSQCPSSPSLVYVSPRALNPSSRAGNDPAFRARATLGIKTRMTKMTDPCNRCSVEASSSIFPSPSVCDFLRMRHSRESNWTDKRIHRSRYRFWLPLVVRYVIAPFVSPTLSQMNTTVLPRTSLLWILGWLD